MTIALKGMIRGDDARFQFHSGFFRRSRSRFGNQMKKEISSELTLTSQLTNLSTRCRIINISVPRCDGPRVGTGSGDKDIVSIRVIKIAYAHTPPCRPRLRCVNPLLPSLPPSLHAILPSFSAVAELRSCEVIADVCTRNPINELAVTTGDDDDDDRAVVLCSSSGSHFAVVVVVRFDGAVALYLLTERASDGFMVV